MGEKMPAKQNGLGILDSKDWDEIKDLDWEEKPSWKNSLAGWTQASPKLLSSPRASWAFRRLKAVLWPMPKQSGPAEPLRKTAYLDGLRGFAAFLVYWQHHQLWAHGLEEMSILENAFGFEGHYSFASFHGVRLLFNGGHFAVATFFVISGYVLSTKPLSLIQAGEQAKLADNLGSALFRRWLRLYIPLLATTFLFMLSWHAFGGLWVPNVKKQSNLRDEIWWWYAELKNFSFIFNSGGEPWVSYNFHLWSIPVEMKGSIVVYTSLLAFSRATTKARLWCTAGLMFYFMYICDGWYCCLFMMGMFLADLDLLSAKGQLPRLFARFSPYKEFIYYHLLAMAVYLGGIPAQTTDVELLRRNRGWYYLSLLKPQATFDYKWFYLFFAATFLVSATPRIPWLRRFFETRFCQYLGRVSFALYLVHGPVLWTLGDRIYSAVGWASSIGSGQVEGIPQWVDRFPLPMYGPLGLEVAFLVPHLILLPVTFWCAEMVTKFIDEPAVRFAQSLYRRTLADPSAGAAAAAAAAGAPGGNGVGIGAGSGGMPGKTPKTPKLEA
jgi:peptidoglycan/LPS O-acetylase OafA/YrhL